MTTETEPIQATTRSPMWVRFVVGKRPIITLLRVLVLVVLSFLAFRYWLIPIRVTGNSMLPTYKNGSVNFINQLAYRRQHPQRGDVVGVKMSEQGVLLLKRVLGLPGETVAVANGKVFINGQNLKETYTQGEPPWRVAEFTLQPYEYFVIGDNRTISELHRKDENDIIGRVIF